MSIQDWAAIAEIVGALFIVITLLYLAIQIRDSNREARAATLHAVLDSENQFNAMVAEHAGTWDKVVNGEPLSDGEETRRAIVLFNMLMADSENRFHQFNAGYLGPESWEARRLTLRGNVRMPIYQVWKGSLGGRNRSAEFLSFLDELADRVED
jgi:hypothetical protein